MREIVWLEDAENDLEEIYLFYFLKNSSIATKITSSILTEIQRLKKWPDIGSIEPLKTNQKYIIRSLITKDGLFKIVYFTTEKATIIVRIWCCRKKPETLTI